MPQTYSFITVVPGVVPGIAGYQTVAVSITNLAGVTLGAYTAVNGSTAFTFPATISTPTTFYLTAGGPVLVSAIAGANQQVATAGGTAATVQTDSSGGAGTVQCAIAIDDPATSSRYNDGLTFLATDYGANGDGTTNNRSAFLSIATALTAAPVATRKVLIIPAGTYTWTQTATNEALLTLTGIENLTILGYGATIQIENTNATGKRGFWFTSCNNLIVEGVTFNLAATVTNASCRAVMADTCGTASKNGVTVRRCTFTSASTQLGTHATRFLTCFGSTVEDSTIDNYGQGVDFTVGAVRCRVQRCLVTNSLNANTAPLRLSSTGTTNGNFIEGNVVDTFKCIGIQCDGAAVIRNNEVRNGNTTAASTGVTAVGIHVLISSKQYPAAIVNNTVENIRTGGSATYAAGIWAGDLSASSTGTDVVIQGNHVWDCTSAYIYTTADYSTVSGNICRYTTVSPSDASMAVRGNYCTVSGNTVESNTVTEGLVAQLTTGSMVGLSVCGNTFTANAGGMADGFRLVSVTGGVISGNVIIGARDNGVTFFSGCDRTLVANNVISTTVGNASSAGVRVTATSNTNNRISTNVITVSGNNFTVGIADAGTTTTVLA
jgi:hypothetical protein